MIKSFCFAALATAALITSAAADDYDSYPVDRPCYPFQRSYRTGDTVLIPPYRHVFQIRMYTTPQQQPYYNVPPYPVETPY